MLAHTYIVDFTLYNKQCFSNLSNVQSLPQGEKQFPKSLKIFPLDSRNLLFEKQCLEKAKSHSMKLFSTENYQ